LLLSSDSQPGRSNPPPAPPPHVPLSTRQEWPLGNAEIDRARGNLLASLEGSRYRVPDAASFRLLVSAPGDAELWVAVLPT